MDKSPQAPSRCPSCSGPRTWSGAFTDESGRRPVRCLGCDRAARACPDCGWELTGTRRTTEGVVACVSCVLTHQTAPNGMVETRSLLIVLNDAGSRPDDVARADHAEATALAVYRARTAFAAGVSEAVDRAEALARLDAALERLQAQQREVA